MDWIEVLRQKVNERKPVKGGHHRRNKTERHVTRKRGKGAALGTIQALRKDKQ